MDRVELDKSSFKALASDTRIEIIKNLNKNNMRVTDLAEKMQLSKPTLIEHLKKLEESGLIDKENRGEKWVYYRLTDKSRNLLEPKSDIRIKILLATSVVAFITGFVQLFRYFSPFQTGTEMMPMDEESREASENAPAPPLEDLFSIIPWDTVILLGVAVVMLSVAIWYFKTRSSPLVE
ncbi:MAG: winged helix-turn-helix domain-containing protein [Methanohalobium sp.]|uniref:winged helix-turn-helix domain-containing protein n=1 Tax=Methanohalobium sp. TaxID=2837493 RepID=UPI00397E20B4